MPEFDPRAVARLEPYLLPGEQMRVAMQEHWAAKVEPVVTALVGFVAVLLISAWLPARLGVLSDVSWWLWFALLARAAWSLIEWHVSWFIATNKRLLLLYGVVTKKVAMMPLSKVTDMSYSRSVPARLLGFGTFTLESAGQEQALHEITYVREPDETYRTICQEIFGSPDPADAWPDGGTNGPYAGGTDPDDPDRPGGPDRPAGPDRPGDGPDADDRDGHGPGDGDDPRDPDEERDATDPADRRGGRRDPRDTDVPVQRLGSYLAPSDRSSFGQRWVRRRRREPVEDRVSAAADDAPGWEVSHEDASPYEQVPRRNAGWWD
ncbi:PH domain-containing protein [Barrientosiimonas humi]|uniref:PH domain-containing protein n=1 Tax=Barrientosiimonas humi TaxID=999931 RepID=UPI00370D46D3